MTRHDSNLGLTPAGSRPPGDGRESIWSVPPGRLAQYFGLFSLFASLGVGFLLWYEIFWNTTDTLPQTVLALIQGLGLNAAGAAGLSLQIVERPRFIMVMADYFTKKWLNPLKEQLREEGRAQVRAEARSEVWDEVNAMWQAWNERRMAAEAKGEPFNEPPPGDS